MEHTTRTKARATKKTKKVPEASKTVSVATPKMPPISPLTDNQAKFFDTFQDYQVHSLTGCPGTGKTFLALYQALELQRSDSRNYTHVKVIRSSVSGRDMGFQPGNDKQKMSVYEAAYRGVINDLYDSGTAWETLTQKHIVEFQSTSFLRGVTFKDCVVVVDEAQNCSYQELYTIMTRVGKNCKVIITGDIMQDDLTNPRYKESSGYGEILKILGKIRSCNSITFGVEDIVRSGFVKDFIIASLPSSNSNSKSPNDFNTLAVKISEQMANY